MSENFMETFFVLMRRTLAPELAPVVITVSCIVSRVQLYSDALLDTSNADSRT